VVAAHDFAEDEAERFSGRLVVVRKPAASRSRIDASEKRQVRFCLGWESHRGKISKPNAIAVDATDISVRALLLILLGLLSFALAAQILSVDPRGSCDGTSVHSTHERPLLTET
jgi:hypothetical protein